MERHLDPVTAECFSSRVALGLQTAAALRWTRAHAPWVGLCSFLAGTACAMGNAAPGRDLAALASALAHGIGSARVETRDLRWEPSRGPFEDLVVGRWLLFLARATNEDTRDVWRARVRVAPDGAVLQIADLHDLTNTPLGDDHQLVVHGGYAAFSTRAYGQEQGVTLLSLEGEGAQNKTTQWLDRGMAALTNLQRTGRPAGIGRVQVTLEAPGSAVGLQLGDETLDIDVLYRDGHNGDGRSGLASGKAQIDLGRGELSTLPEGFRADASMHLPKRFSHWIVDTLRAVPWIGPAPIAWMEDEALAARDLYRRITFSSHAATDQVASTEPVTPALDTSRASLEEAHWPPQPIATIWKSPEPGEGQWAAPDVPWLRRVPEALPDGPAPFAQTFVRPDPDRPYSRVLLVAMDMRQLDLGMEAGVEDPEPLTGPPGSGRIPRDPAVYRRVAAAFNGAFKTEHGHYGMMVDKRVLLPPVPGSATVVVLRDGRVGFGTWGADRRVGGLVGVADDDIVSFRQNLDPLVDRGQLNPTGRNLWGFTLPGKGAQTERTALCVTTAGHLLYAWGDDLSATTLGRALQMAGCEYGLHLDMNPYHTGFIFTAIDDLSAKKYKSQLLTPAMSIPADRYIQYAPKDFFYVATRDPTPPALPGASPWTPDGGAQPPPSWLPGLWRSRLDEPGATVELVDVEPARATWRVRAGLKEAVLASPLREMAGDEANSVLLAAGMGVAPEQRSLGLATDGHLAVPVRGGDDAGVLLLGHDGRVAIERADAAPLLGAHDDLVELPLLLWDGRSIAAQAGQTLPRLAIGLSPSGRVVIARGSLSSAGPLAEGLARAGCTRALSLDRGLHATGFIDRSGTDSPPRGRYPESVLYAVGTPLRPRAFRFDAVSAAEPAVRPK
jgi:hypothetical protein